MDLKLRQSITKTSYILISETHFILEIQHEEYLILKNYIIEYYNKNIIFKLINIGKIILY